MRDIVERMRELEMLTPTMGARHIVRAGADEIERLRAALDTSRELREYDAKEIARLKALNA